MKRLLSILFLCACALSAMAVVYQPYRHSNAGKGYTYQPQEDGEEQVPTTADFHSTSIYSSGSYTPERNYSVSVAATTVTGGVTTEDEGTPGRTIRRVTRPGDSRPGDENDPRTDPESPLPVGDTPWLLMMALAVLFITKRVRTAHLQD